MRSVFRNPSLPALRFIWVISLVATTGLAAIFVPLTESMRRAGAPLGDGASVAFLLLATAAGVASYAVPARMVRWLIARIPFAIAEDASAGAGYREVGAVQRRIADPDDAVRKFFPGYYLIALVTLSVAFAPLLIGLFAALSRGELWLAETLVALSFVLVAARFPTMARVVALIEKGTRATMSPPRPS